GKRDRVKAVGRGIAEAGADVAARHAGFGNKRPARVSEAEERGESEAELGRGNRADGHVHEVAFLVAGLGGFPTGAAGSLLGHEGGGVFRKTETGDFLLDDEAALLGR